MSGVSVRAAKTEKQDSMRLSRQEIVFHRNALSKWQSPAVMEQCLNTIAESLNPGAIFGPEMGFLRDAWIAAKFGALRPATEVRLVAEQDRWPDFEARIGEEVYSYECVEADIPGRRRGNELRRAKQTGLQVEHDPVENWIERANAIPRAIREVIKRKCNKHYDGRVQLAIYLNINEYGIRQKEIEASFGNLILEGLTHFDSIWIVWKTRLYGPWHSIPALN